MSLFIRAKGAFKPTYWPRLLLTNRTLNFWPKRRKYHKRESNFRVTFVKVTIAIVGTFSLSSHVNVLICNVKCFSLGLSFFEERRHCTQK